jgi:hypothetical protein
VRDISLRDELEHGFPHRNEEGARSPSQANRTKTSRAHVFGKEEADVLDSVKNKAHPFQHREPF